MFIPSDSGAAASTASAAIPAVLSNTTPHILPEKNREQVRHMIFGSPAAVKSDIQHMHKLGYTDIHNWSPLMSTGRAGEVMTILTKKVDVS